MYSHTKQINIKAKNTDLTEICWESIWSSFCLCLCTLLGLEPRTNGYLRCQFNIPDQTLAVRFPVSTCYRAIPAGIPSPRPEPLQSLSFLSLPPVSDSYITSAILATVSVTVGSRFPGTLFAPSPFSSFLTGPNHGPVQFSCGAPHIHNRPLQYTPKSIMSSFFSFIYTWPGPAIPLETWSDTSHGLWEDMFPVALFITAKKYTKPNSHQFVDR